MNENTRRPYVRFRWVVGVISFALAALSGRAAEVAIYNTQTESIPLLKPQEAVTKFRLPAGFEATLFAGEPDVQQPIAMALDARGRLWVAENYTYSEASVNWDVRLHDRIVILEDTNRDGHFDKRTVFWDRSQKLTGIAVGFGGVYAICPPRLLFIPDRNGDDVPDAEPQVLLDGWEDGAIRHTIANGLKWGPDGWLYGRHGIQATSRVGKPGTPPEKRVPINVGMWRYHPQKGAFEVVAEGGTNPWGHDWDDYGQLFFINTVIGHLWHVVPGGWGKRMYGEHAKPYLYELIDQTADHVHWSSKEVWTDVRKEVTSSTSEAGGGHAHTGLMFYLGENWPAEYRNDVFMINFHGRRLNRDKVERSGAGYVAHHAKDFLFTDDAWFRGIDLLQGPGGAVYISDWSDIGECHDQEGIHRQSGRIYKVTYGPHAKVPQSDLRLLSSLDLARMQSSPNEWLVRQARLVLQERHVEGKDSAEAWAELENLLMKAPDVRQQLRALWALYVTGHTTEGQLLGLLGHPSEHIRLWALQLLADHGSPSPAALERIAEVARKDASGLVLAFVTASIRHTEAKARWPILEGLAGRTEFANDRTLPLLIWYQMADAVGADPERAVRLEGATSIGKIQRYVARRLTEGLAANPEPVNQLLSLLARDGGEGRRTNVLAGMLQASKGWRKAVAPVNWASTRSKLEAAEDEFTRGALRELAVVFGDGRASDELRVLATNTAADFGTRRQALNTLVQSRATNLTPILQKLIVEADMAADAIRALAVVGGQETPKMILNVYARLRPAARMEAVNALAGKPAFAVQLLSAVEKSAVPRKDVGAFQIRQMRSLGVAEIGQRLDKIWPEWKPLTGEKKELLAKYSAQLSTEALSKADRAQGRAIFALSCGVCHQLFGEGGKVGPDITGADRKNLDYLLQNILDPSAVVADGYKVLVVTMKDERVLNGIKAAQSDSTLTLQTMTEKMTLERSEIASIAESTMSMMPEGLLNGMEETQVRDLVAYLMSSAQVALPAKP